MSSRPVLPPPLAARLEALGPSLYRGEINRSEVATCATLILDLPPRIARRGGEAIRGALQLHWWRAGWQAANPSWLARVQAWLTGRRLPRWVKSDFDRLVQTPGLEILFLVHGDGKLREASLDKLEGPCATAFEVAMILDRLNDWVAPVRAAAEDCANRRFSRTAPALLAGAWVGLAGQMSKWRRGEEQPRTMAALTSRQEVRDAIVQTIIDSREGAVSGLMEAVLRLEAFDPHLEHLARKAQRPHIRQRALATLLAGEARWRTGYERRWIDKSMGLSARAPTAATRPLTVRPELSTLIALGAGDRSAVVRRAAADGLITHRHALSDWRELAARLLADPNAAVRQRAEWVRDEMSSKPAAPQPSA